MLQYINWLVPSCVCLLWQVGFWSFFTKNSCWWWRHESSRSETERYSKAAEQLNNELKLWTVAVSINGLTLQHTIVWKWHTKVTETTIAGKMAMFIVWPINSHLLKRRGKGLWTILQTATTGRSSLFGFTFNELSCHPSINIASGFM